MSAAPEAAPAAAPAATAKKKSPVVMILLIVVAVVAMGGGAGAFFYVRRASPAAPPPAAKLSEKGLISFEPFVANLADPGGTRFIRVTIRLVVDSPAKAKEIEEKPVLVMQARSKILELLAQQTAEHVVTPEGKNELKKAVLEHVAESFEEVKVSDVLFSEFVVQF